MDMSFLPDPDYAIPLFTTQNVRSFSVYIFFTVSSSVQKTCFGLAIQCPNFALKMVISPAEKSAWAFKGAPDSSQAFWKVVQAVKWRWARGTSSMVHLAWFILVHQLFPIDVVLSGDPVAGF